MQTLISGLGIRKPSPSPEHFICNLSYENNESLNDLVFWDFPGDTVAKTLRFQLQETQVQSLVRELGPTCLGEEFTCHKDPAQPDKKKLNIYIHLLLTDLLDY